MLSGIGSYGYAANQAYTDYRLFRVRPDAAGQAARTGGTRLVRTAVPAAQLEQPVDAVRPVEAAWRVTEETPLDRAGLLRQLETDPAAARVRGQIQYPAGSQAQSAALQNGAPGEAEWNGPAAGRPPVFDGLPLDGEEQVPTYVLPGQKTASQSGDPRVVDARGKTPEELMNQLMGLEDEDGGETDGTGEVKSAQEVMEESECQTCKERKYQDGSDDPGVSFKTAAHIDPSMAQSAVRGHENEHVVREQAKADREGREVVSQSVTLHTAICPECGRVYTSGGTTRTVTADAPEQPAQDEEKNGEKADQAAAA